MFNLDGFDRGFDGRFPDRLEMQLLCRLGTLDHWKTHSIRVLSRCQERRERQERQE
jgi:hypothetical protein